MAFKEVSPGNQSLNCPTGVDGGPPSGLARSWAELSRGMSARQQVAVWFSS